MTENLQVTPANVEQVAKEIARKKYGGIQIKPVHTLDSGVVLAIFGRGGAGKTTVAATITDTPLGSPGLILDCFGNTHVVSSYADRLDVSHIDNFAQATKTCEDIANDPSCPYKSIIFDNMTALNMMRLRELYGATTDLVWKQYAPTSADMFQLTLSAMMLATGKHKMNVVFLFQEAKETRDIEGKEYNVMEIAANKAVQEQFPGLVSFVGRIYIDQDFAPFNRTLDFTPNVKIHQAKVQYDPKHPTAKTIPMQIYKPSLAPLIECLRGNIPFPVDKHKKPLGG